jgi:hypothetical protein
MWIMGEHARYLSPKDFKKFLKGTHGAPMGGRGGVFLGGFVSTKGMMMGCHLTKNCKSLIFLIAIIQTIKKEIHVCYYVTQIWKGRKIPKQHLKEKHHKNHAKGIRIIFLQMYVDITNSFYEKKKFS